MPFRLRYLFIISLLLLASLACNLTGSSSDNAASGEVLFQDNFSNPSSGWDSLENETGITNYTEGGYRILVLSPDTEMWSNPGLNFTDVYIDVDATRLGGPMDNDFGVICRYQDIENFYYMVVTSDGYYGILKVKDGEPTLLGRDQMGTTEQSLAGRNHLRASCVGNQLILQVNGELLDTQQDSEYTSGDVGLIAGTYSEAGVDILFQNFTVIKP